MQEENRNIILVVSDNETLIGGEFNSLPMFEAMLVTRIDRCILRTHCLIRYKLLTCKMKRGSGQCIANHRYSI
jgi:hypothetical protein